MKWFHPFPSTASAPTLLTKHWKDTVATTILVTVKGFVLFYHISLVLHCSATHLSCSCNLVMLADTHCVETYATTISYRHKNTNHDSCTRHIEAKSIKSCIKLFIFLTMTCLLTSFAHLFAALLCYLHEQCKLVFHQHDRIIFLLFKKNRHLIE